MSENIASSKRIQYQFAVAGFTFSVGLIAYLVAYGSPTNSLHESALAWSFVVLIGTLASAGLTVIRDLLPASRPKS